MRTMYHENYTVYWILSFWGSAYPGDPVAGTRVEVLFLNCLGMTGFTFCFSTYFRLINVSFQDHRFWFTFHAFAWYLRRISFRQLLFSFGVNGPAVFPAWYSTGKPLHVSRVQITTMLQLLNVLSIIHASRIAWRDWNRPAFKILISVD